MNKAQDAGILSIDRLRSVEPNRMTQLAANAEVNPKAGKKSAEC